MCQLTPVALGGTISESSALKAGGNASVPGCTENACHARQQAWIMKTEEIFPRVQRPTHLVFLVSVASPGW